MPKVPYLQNRNPPLPQASSLVAVIQVADMHIAYLSLGDCHVVALAQSCSLLAMTGWSKVVMFGNGVTVVLQQCTVRLKCYSL
jgi:hypothetical protein